MGALLPFAIGLLGMVIGLVMPESDPHCYGDPWPELIEVHRLSGWFVGIGVAFMILSIFTTFYLGSTKRFFCWPMVYRFTYDNVDSGSDGTQYTADSSLYRCLSIR